MGKVSMQCNLFLFYPFRTIKAKFNRLNLRLSQKITHLDTFLNKVCSSKVVVLDKLYLSYSMTTYFITIHNLKQ